MQYSWNEIRARATKFAEEFVDAHYEKGETQTFYNEFFRIFGVKRRSVATYERSVAKLSGNQGFIDLFWPSVLLVEQKSAGRSLEAAQTQALEYCQGLKQTEHPRYLLLCDFQNFHLIDLEERAEYQFTLVQLPQFVEKFGFIMGVQTPIFKDQDPANIEAAELIGKLHDTLEDSGFTGDDLEKFLVRIVFCLFADDTGVFPERNMMLGWLHNRTHEDGSDLGPKLTQLFQTLDTREAKRGKHLDEDLNAFPYINGDLFRDSTRIPSFNSDMRQALITACEFDWSPISPAIFGSLFQSVMNREERRKGGAHYTTEKNIQKVISPLFMDGLWAEFEAAKAKTRGRKQALVKLHDKLSELTFFDPACGCGNFLIIAYREIRLLEIEILKILTPKKQLELDVAVLSKVDVDQFYGIEIGEFATEIARAAMWMMDHLMNNALSAAFGQNYARIPLVKSAKIVRGDALELDWAEAVIKPKDCDYILGNPPFIGAKFQSQKQRVQTRDIARLGGSGGTLDYVAAWFLKAGEFANCHKNPIGIGFVSTNSITQGEQVAQLWPLLFDRYGLEISFAHQTFAWSSEARGKAAVHVIIIGLAKRGTEPDIKQLFTYVDLKGDPKATECKAISPYLIGLRDIELRYLTVPETGDPLFGKRKLKTGVQMIDNGILTFTDQEYTEFLKIEPDAKNWFKRYIGGDEFINGFYRWILYLREISPTEIRKLPAVKARIAEVRKYRSSSKRPSTIKMAETPHLIGVDERPKNAILVIPNTSSELRDYIPIGYLEKNYIANQKLRILPDPEIFEFAILTSAMHMGWMRTVTGRLESRYMYSVGVVYNTFPWPDLTDAAKAKLTQTGQAILDARAQYPDATLADLYDPDSMPAPLRKAHTANDKAVDALYRAKAFESEGARVEHLFTLYEALQAPLTTQSKKPLRKRAKPS